MGYHVETRFGTDSDPAYLRGRIADLEAIVFARSAGADWRVRRAHAYWVAAVAAAWLFGLFDVLVCS